MIGSLVGAIANVLFGTDATAGDGACCGDGGACCDDDGNRGARR